jgi:hypothetical protein
MQPYLCRIFAERRKHPLHLGRAGAVPSQNDQEEVLQAERMAADRTAVAAGTAAAVQVEVLMAEHSRRDIGLAGRRSAVEDGQAAGCCWNATNCRPACSRAYS